MLKTYPEQLTELATTASVDLKDAFEKAGIPSSTYYRSMQGPRHMTFETADKVARAIVQLSAP
jgi:predicted transcriptional regulator